jgi:hypothetical protein
VKKDAWNTNNLKGTFYTRKISRGRIRPIIIIVVINSHMLMDLGRGTGKTNRKFGRIRLVSLKYQQIQKTAQITNTLQENNKREKILNLHRGAVISMQNTTGRCKRIIQLNECM